MTDWSAFYDDTRDDWDARAPLRPCTTVELGRRTEFFSHYIGPGAPAFATRPHADCLAQVRVWQRFHQSKDWKDLGYNALVCGHARAIEGRGLQFSGSHCPDHNVSGFGVQFMVAGIEVPTPAMYARMRRLYDELVRAKGSTLAKRGHRDGIATACPGDAVYGWVRSGMVYPTGTGGMTAPIGGGSVPTRPAPKPAPKPKPSSGLTVDGKLGPATIKRWQKVMGTEQDGEISRPSELVRAVQKHLYRRGYRLVVDGKGIQSNNGGDYGPTNTVKALQRYLGTKADGVLSHPTSDAVKALQRKLNEGKF